MCKTVKQGSGRVQVTIQDGKILVVSEYNADWVKRAKEIGGRWNAAAKAWSFVCDDADVVSDSLIEIYGDDGSGDVNTVTVLLRVDLLRDGQEIAVCGIPVCRRRYRDERVRMGDGVILVTGGFPESGGSRNSPRCCAQDETVVRLSVPDVLYQKMIKDEEIRDAVTLAEDPDGSEYIDAIKDSEPQQIADINAILKSLQDKMQAEIDKIEQAIKIERDATDEDSERRISYLLGMRWGFSRALQLVTDQSYNL